MGLNTNNVGEPSLLSYKLLKYIVSLHPSPPFFPTLLYISKSLPMSWVQETRKLSVVLFLECFALKTNFGSHLIKMLPVQCNAMRLVSKEENVSKNTKLSKTPPDSTQLCPAPHQPMPPPYLPPPPTLPLTVSKLQDRKGSSILSITKENRKFRYFHFLISGGS